MKLKYFKVPHNLNLKEFSTTYQTDLDPLTVKKELKKYRNKIAELQDMMYADDRYSVLICFQGMDTAGKDSMIREIFKGFNARGVVVESFKTPSYKELQHDFMLGLNLEGVSRERKMTLLACWLFGSIMRV